MEFGGNARGGEVTPRKDSKKGITMSTLRNTIQELSQLANELEDRGLIAEAEAVHNVFVRTAQVLENEEGVPYNPNVPNPQQLQWLKANRPKTTQWLMNSGSVGWSFDGIKKVQQALGLTADGSLGKVTNTTLMLMSDDQIHEALKKAFPKK